MADTAPKIAAKERREPVETVAKKAALLAAQIQKSKHFIVFTGAGISTSAGIPDFRGPDGSWTLLAQGRRRDGPTTSTLQAIPTPSHMALVELQNRGLLKYVVSQNCDGLHKRSGIPSDKISEVHGNSNLEYCKACGKEYLRDFRAVATYETSVHDHRTGRQCALCNGALYDTIINFGEPLPQKAFDLAQHHAQQADLCLVLGSSCTVSPACDIPALVGDRSSATLAICNLQETPLDEISDVRIYSTADDLMMRIMVNLGLDIPRFILRRRLALTTQPRKDGGCAIVVQGVDAEGVPMTFLKSVKVEGTRRVSRCEPHVIHLREGLAAGCEVKIELEFMGHYREPNLHIHHEVACGDGEGEETGRYLLEFDPYAGLWMTTKSL